MPTPRSHHTLIATSVTEAARREVDRLLEDDDALQRGVARLGAGDGEPISPRELEREQGDPDDSLDPEERFELDLREMLEGSGNDGLGRIATFAEDGVLTNNRGLVVEMPYGTFQVCVVRKS